MGGFERVISRVSAVVDAAAAIFLAIITALTLGGAAAGLRFAWLDREAGLPERGDG